MLLDTLDTTLSGNILVGKRMNSAEKGFLRAGYGSLIKNQDF